MVRIRRSLVVYYKISIGWNFQQLQLNECKGWWVMVIGLPKKLVYWLHSIDQTSDQRYCSSWLLGCSWHYTVWLVACVSAFLIIPRFSWLIMSFISGHGLFMAMLWWSSIFGIPLLARCASCGCCSELLQQPLTDLELTGLGHSRTTVRDIGLWCSPVEIFAGRDM